MPEMTSNWMDRIAPGAWMRWARMRFGWRWFRGAYQSWDEALTASSGYDAADVLLRVVAATRVARLTPGAWERDGAVFQHPEQNEPLLGALANAAAGGGLEVVDFGGSLGSTWWQHRERLAALGLRRWVVVEQPHFVEAGREFADDILGFAPTMAAALASVRPQVVLFSGVLPYLESPALVLKEVRQLGFAHVILDRTPLVSRGSRLAVQHTPPGLGGGSYPVWLLQEDDLLGELYRAYENVASWPALDRLAPEVKHKGFHFARRP